MIDVGFPIIEYSARQTPREWGEAHGETYRDAIRELTAIRRNLMYEKNTGLRGEIVNQLAEQQWQITSDYDADLAAELQGIARGAGLSIGELVILNNYTDFRDIHVPEQGCSTVYVHRGHPVAGQTWDMHGSAKRYVCVLDVPTDVADQRIRVFSVVGCVGMMGYHSAGQVVGVNNINTNGARPGVLWPVVVRRMLRAGSAVAMVELLTSAPVTSGHAYLIGDRQEASLWEVMPGLAERVAQLAASESGAIFHTNHCLGPQALLREVALARTSTTHIRYRLLEKKLGGVATIHDLYELLNDHENYPQSICSNFQANAHDPSITCGGAAGDLATGQLLFWRGDPLYDSNFVRHEFAR